MGRWKKPDSYQIVYQIHAVKRMARRGVREEDVKHVLLIGEAIEVYSDDKPYPSELLLGWCAGQPLHVVVATDTAGRRKIVITVYVPDPNKWNADFKRRKP